MEEAKRELISSDDEYLAEMPSDSALELAEKLGVVDNGFEELKDFRDRLILMKRKIQNNGHKPYGQFSRVQADVATKRRNLQDILQNTTKVFQQDRGDCVRTPLVDALSETLLRQNLISKYNLLDELTERMKALEGKETLVVVAGETNSGKSTFLNALLGQNVLPTDVLHCTYVVCKIVYSHSYIVETLDYEDHCEEFYCNDFEEARERLSDVAACEDIHRRQRNSVIREITLKMPAEILKSGITLVDTPGIGENDVMDSVTMDYVSDAQASAFIYIIKSDGAGGVQEDRLLTFLRAVKEIYKDTRPEGTFDPQAAMFVCHRWDTINKSEAEKVQRNALMKLGMVWPSFQPSQTYLFSSKKAMLHLDIDPDFITDSFNVLLNGLKQLIDRATHNAIKYQYCWMNHFIASTRSHLRIMIMHCTASKEDLNEHFKEVEEKMQHLMKAANDQIPLLQKIIVDQRERLSKELKQILSLTEAVLSSDLEDYGQLLSACKQDKFLLSRENQNSLEQQIVICLIKYCDDYLQRENVLKSIEGCVFQKIKDHIGLFENQLQQIKNDIQGTERRTRKGSSSSNSSGAKLSQNGSCVSNWSLSSEDEDYEVSHIPDPITLKQEVDNLIKRRKARVSIRRGWKSGIKAVKDVIGGDIGHAGKDPKESLDHRIRKLASKMTADQTFLDSLVSRYLQFPEGCMNHAISCIPHFITVNTKLMYKIGEHQEAFQNDKEFLIHVMENIDLCRAQLQGYKHSHMEDVNFDSINLAMGRSKTSVDSQFGLMLSTRLTDDSGFSDSQSSRREVRSFWAHFLNAEVAQKNTMKKVTIKTYSFAQGDAEQYAEISSLRSLNHKNVASFLGMTRRQAPDGEEEDIKPTPSFIFEGKLKAARIYIKAGHQEYVPSFLCQVWQGLEYIHTEDLVHLELNLDTVMVDSQSGIVKLCQQCTPREVQLPTDLSLLTKAAVCLSPSVLKGNVYQIPDDIYAFGLLIWELLHPSNLPYEEQRDWPLQKFIEEIDPSNMLKSHLARLNSSHAVKTIIEECVIGVGGKAIITRDIQSMKTEIEQDPAITALPSMPLPELARLNSSLNSDSDIDLQNSSMEGDNFNTEKVSAVLSSSRRSKHGSDVREFFSAIPEEEPPVKESKTFLPPPIIPPTRRQRYSQIQAPSFSQLDIPANARRRKISLPNMPPMSWDEKCQRFDLMSNRPYTGNLHMVQDSKDEPDCKTDPLSFRTGRRNSTGVLPHRSIIPGSIRTGQSIGSQRDSEVSIELITNKYRSPLQRSLDAGLNDLHHASARFGNEKLDEIFRSRHVFPHRGTDKSRGAFENPPRFHEASFSDGSSTDSAEPHNHRERHLLRGELRRQGAMRVASSIHRKGSVPLGEKKKAPEKPRSWTFSTVEDYDHAKVLPSNDSPAVSEGGNEQRDYGEIVPDLDSSSESSLSLHSEEVFPLSHGRKNSKPLKTFYIASSSESLSHHHGKDSLSSSYNPHDSLTLMKGEEDKLIEKNTASFNCENEEVVESVLSTPMSPRSQSTTTTTTTEVGDDDSQEEFKPQDFPSIDNNYLTFL